MTGGNNKFAQKVIAIVLIVTLLSFVGVAPTIMLFATGVVVVVYFVSRRSQDRDMQRVFEFYVAADAILRDADRKWFGFELAEVIEEGERALDVIPDSPPLHYFALGALYHRIGNFEATAEYLSRVDDNSWSEHHRMAPSPQLRRYVHLLRQIEYDPSRAPAVLAAIRNLERARSKDAARLLVESRNLLVKPINDQPSSSGQSHEQTPSRSTLTPPPPISEVLHDVYEDIPVEQQPN